MLLVLLVLLERFAQGAPEFLFVGGNNGIDTFLVDGKKYTKASSLSQTGGTSWIALHPTHRYLYAASKENVDYNGRKSGQVVAYSIHEETGVLTQLNKKPSGDIKGPASFLFNKLGFLVVANYVGSAVDTAYGVSVLRVNQDGSLGDLTDVAQLTGKSIVANRQKGPHAHDIAIRSGQNFQQYVFVPDLGSDVIWQFELTPQGKLKPGPKTTVPAGSGPRHMKFHPSLNVAYVLTELNARLLRYTFKPATGTLEYVADYAILPKEAPYTQYKASAAELQISEDGKRLFASVRSVGKIGMFAIDEAGALRFEGALTNLGRPRFFDISPDQTQLYVCNQDGLTNNVRVFNVDGKAFTEDEDVTQMDVVGARTLVFDFEAKSETSQATTVASTDNGKGSSTVSDTGVTTVAMSGTSTGSVETTVSSSSSEVTTTTANPSTPVAASVAFSLRSLSLLRTMGVILCFQYAVVSTICI